MTSTELIIEAVEYSSDDNSNWWETFNTEKEALKILNKAIKEEPDENQIALLLSYREEYIEEDLTEEQNYIYILKKLKQEMKEEEE